MTFWMNWNIYQPEKLQFLAIFHVFLPINLKFGRYSTKLLYDNKSFFYSYFRPEIKFLREKLKPAFSVQKAVDFFSKYIVSMVTKT